MKPPKPKTILTILDTINWQGHIELSELDKRWLSAEIAGALSEDSAVCGVCVTLKPIVIQTPIGTICEDCIDDIAYDAETVREQLEEDS
jgi:hypothetical protein